MLCLCLCAVNRCGKGIVFTIHLQKICFQKQQQQQQHREQQQRRHRIIDDHHHRRVYQRIKCLKET